ncbi:hypothetical protein [Thauera sp. 2A1]|uniref:hypothetical protein n=1 Tax=Thauera sp. 2A1 TaxID=2570191 RepID=UPI001D175DE4|nr:hypothetical protein [Thauera sp. 2A1]KAI5915588.1 hypothetical protein GH664_06485 [Thauera sp. 2A1]
MSAYPQRQERIGTPEGDFHVEAIDPVRQRVHLTCLTTGATRPDAVLWSESMTVHVEVTATHR